MQVSIKPCSIINLFVSLHSSHWLERKGQSEPRSHKLVSFYPDWLVRPRGRCVPIFYAPPTFNLKHMHLHNPLLHAIGLLQWTVQTRRRFSKIFLCVSRTVGVALNTHTHKNFRNRLKVLSRHFKQNYGCKVLWTLIHDSPSGPWINLISSWKAWCVKNCRMQVWLG